MLQALIYFLASVLACGGMFGLMRYVANLLISQDILMTTVDALTLNFIMMGLSVTIVLAVFAIGIGQARKIKGEI